jgi:hypothetical protein
MGLNIQTFKEDKYIDCGVYFKKKEKQLEVVYLVY